MDHTSFSQIVIDIIVVFMIIAGLDRITHGKLKLGLADSFNEGIEALGALALSMLGILSLAPALVGPITKVVGPIYRLVGADPAMFAGAFLSSDMGGYPLAMSMTSDPDVGCFSGIILGALLGIVIVFTIPVALGILRPEDRKYLAQGVLYGVITVPIGGVVGGFVAGYDASMILVNSIPTLIIAILLALGIKFIPNGMIKGFDIFGKLIVSLISVGLVCAIIEELTGFVIIPGMAPISDGYTVIGNIAIVLAGAFPMVAVIKRVFRKSFDKIGEKVGINSVAVTGFIASLANVIPMLTTMKDMDERGKILNCAWAVSAAFMLGDHLAFTASVEKELIGAMIAAKAASGICAVLLAYFATRHLASPMPEAVKADAGSEE